MPSEPSSPDPEPPQPVGCEIVLQNPGRNAGLELGGLRRWLGALAAELAPEARSLTVRLTSDRAMRALNHSYRGRDRSTDVLSFPGPFAAPPGPADLATDAELAGHLGDVAIAVPTARRQAAAAGHGLARELRLLSLHGLLHCLGHDHETDDGAMERLEARLRRRWLDRDPTLPADSRVAPR